MTPDPELVRRYEKSYAQRLKQMEYKHWRGAVLYPWLVRRFRTFLDALLVSAAVALAVWIILRCL